MRLKIENKLNILPIGVFLIWVIYVLYFFFFKINSFANETPCGAGILMIGIPIFTIFISFTTLIIMLILNKIKKEKYYVDYEYITIPFLVLIFAGMISLFF